jgi:uncharacterized protein YgiB involved in biofilm formation
MGKTSRHSDTTGGRVSRYLSLIKALAAGAIAGSAIVGASSPGVAQPEAPNRAGYSRLLSDIDARKSVVFTSVDGCVANGFSREQCEAGRRTALAFAEEHRTALRYSSRDLCSRTHGDTCSATTGMTPILTWINGVPNTNYIYTTTHRPSVVGWQAAADDLAKAVPLYATPDPAIGIRRDGARVELAR